MKQFKLFAIALIAVFVGVSLSSCSDDSDGKSVNDLIDGTWKLVTIKYDKSNKGNDPYVYDWEKNGIWDEFRTFNGNLCTQELKWYNGAGKDESAGVEQYEKWISEYVLDGEYIIFTVIEEVVSSWATYGLSGKYRIVRLNDTELVFESDIEGNGAGYTRYTEYFKRIK